MKSRQIRLQLALAAALIVVLNLIANSIFTRFDLTKEKRYSLSEYTHQVLDSVDYPMVFTVYLEGEFPANIREFQDAVRTTLLEMKQYAGRNLEFEFVDPSGNPELLAEFTKNRYEPLKVNLKVSNTEVRRQVVWPLAQLRYRDREVWVNLVRGNMIVTPDGLSADLVRAEADLEYKLVSAMRNLTRTGGGLVAMLQGHGELRPDQVPEMLNEIQNSYKVYTFDMKVQAGQAISPSVQVLLVLNPTKPFSERDKYELDQYLMRGGHILWMLDNQSVDMDMFNKTTALSELRDLNLDDLFLKYGCKINYDLVQDLECEKTEVVQVNAGKADFETRPWIFYPLIYRFPEHPIDRNVEAVLLRYASSIDTFPQPDVQKSVFLHTSPRSRSVQGQQLVDISTYLNTPVPQALFNRQQIITGVVMEGIFQSLFTGREAPVDSAAPQKPSAMFGESNNPDAPGAIAIISDADFLKGKEFRGETGAIPYDNKILTMNVIDYLAGGDALTGIRSKEVAERRLSRSKIISYGSLVTAANLILPIALLAIYGFSRFYLRRRRNERLKTE